MAILEDPALYSTDPSEVWRRVSGRGKMSGKQMAVLERARALARGDGEPARHPARLGGQGPDPRRDRATQPRSSIAELKNIRGFPAQGVGSLGQADPRRHREGEGGGPDRRLPKARRGRPRYALARSPGWPTPIVRSRSEAAGVATELVSTRGELEAFLADLFDGGRRRGPSPTHARMAPGAGRRGRDGSGRRDGSRSRSIDQEPLHRRGSAERLRARSLNGDGRCLTKKIG